jgi:hypothetical protein
MTRSFIGFLYHPNVCAFTRLLRARVRDFSVVVISLSHLIPVGNYAGTSDE